MLYIVWISGGLSSYEALRRTIVKHGKENVRAVFSDTLAEDPDLYRFLNDIEKLENINIERIADGRTIFQVWHDHRAIKIGPMAICSKVLKKQVCDRYLLRLGTQEYTQVLGLSWIEQHRIDRICAANVGKNYWFPLAEKPYISNDDIIAKLKSCGIQPPRLYAAGFSHNNCHGACVRAGHASWKRLLLTFPEIFDLWEKEEQRFRDEISPNVAILTRTINGVKKPYTLLEFKVDVLGGCKIDSTDEGGCGCFNQMSIDDMA